MGCDIHLHVEIKVDSVWHHYNHPNVDRSYDLFRKMAGIRPSEDGPTPIAEPRGLPVDISFITEMDVCDRDGYSHSWLGPSEIKKVTEWFESIYGCRHPPIFGYLFGFRIYARLDVPETKPQEIEDVRIVFWFDN